MEFTIEDINYDRYVPDFYPARGLRLSSQENYYKD